MKKQFRITLNGKSYEVVAELVGEDEPAAFRLAVAADAAAPAATRPARTSGAAAVAAPAPKATPAAAAGSGDVPSPLAGKVVSVDVSMGAQVEAGQKVITLEAMKMNTVVNASASGTVKAILVAAGDSVEEGQPLLTIE